MGNCLRAPEISPGKLDPFLHWTFSRLVRGHFLKVLFVTTEMDDFVRVGGLAAVSAALPRALRPWIDVRIMLPGYRDVVEQFSHIEIVGQCAALAEMPACSLGRARPGTACRSTSCSARNLRPAGQSLWRRIRPRLAGQRRPFRTICLCRRRACHGHAGQELGSGPRPRQRLAGCAGAGLSGMEGRKGSLDPDHPQPRLPGTVPAGLLRRIGAPESSFHIDGLEFYDKLSFLKGGIVYASHLTTVSATYAREITTRELGCGLEGLLRRARTPRN